MGTSVRDYSSVPDEQESKMLIELKSEQVKIKRTTVYAKNVIVFNRKVLVFFLANAFLLLFALFYSFPKRSDAYVHVGYGRERAEMSCQLPKLDPWDASIKNKVHPEKQKPKCNTIKQRSHLQDRILTIEKNMRGCQWRCISRKNNTDGGFAHTEWAHIKVN